MSSHTNFNFYSAITSDNNYVYAVSTAINIADSYPRDAPVLIVIREFVFRNEF